MEEQREAYKQANAPLKNVIRRKYSESGAREKKNISYTEPTQEGEEGSLKKIIGEERQYTLPDVDSTALSAYPGCIGRSEVLWRPSEIKPSSSHSRKQKLRGCLTATEDMNS